MKFFRVVAALVPLLLAACGLTPQQQADYAEVHESEVSRSTYHKMLNGDDLTLYDITSLAQARVSDEITLRYLRHQRTVYYLTPGDIASLQKGGVSREVIEFMLQTPHEYISYYPASGSGVGYFPYYDPFWGPPYPNYPYPPHFSR
jgi:hypothetical protein